MLRMIIVLQRRRTGIPIPTRGESSQQIANANEFQFASRQAYRRECVPTFDEQQICARASLTVMIRRADDKTCVTVSQPAVDKTFTKSFE